MNYKEWVESLKHANFEKYREIKSYCEETGRPYKTVMNWRSKQSVPEVDVSYVKLKTQYINLAKELEQSEKLIDKLQKTLTEIKNDH